MSDITILEFPCAGALLDEVMRGSAGFGCCFLGFFLGVDDEDF
jgi:hypothetical protein